MPDVLAIHPRIGWGDRRAHRQAARRQAATVCRIGKCGMSYVVLAAACLFVGYRLGVSMERARALLDRVPDMLNPPDPRD
jgi:hypothetical protein